MNIKHIGEIPTESPPPGTLNTGGYKILRFSINNSLYLANNTKERHNYDRRRIGYRTRTFEWCHFQ